MHDAAHYLLVRERRLNDLMSNLSLSFPLLISTSCYRDHHMAHHRHLNTPSDPDYVDAFSPASRGELLRLLLCDVSGLSTLKSLRSVDQFGVFALWGSSAASRRAERLLFLGSSCIYPRDCPQPMREEYLLTGPLEPTNRPYAIAKIAGVELCWALNRQHHTRFIAAMPANLYGPADNYDLQNSHVLPALIRKAHEAKVRGDVQLAVWGTGTPRREFLYSEDMADACILLMQLPDAKFDALINPPGTNMQPPLINIGCGNDLTVRELAETIARVVGFKGELRLDASKPDGTPRKLLDVSRMEKLGWRPKVSLADGVALAYKDYLMQSSRTLEKSS